MLIQHGQRKHRKYGGSTAKRVTQCHSWANVAMSVPEQPSSPAAVDGTEAHELLDYALKNDIFNADIAYMTMSPSWPHLSMQALRERLEAVQVALDLVNDILRDHADAILSCEQDNEFQSDVLPAGVAGGTTDISIYIPSLRKLIVIDYKHGVGVPVFVLDPKDGLANMQITFYACTVVFGTWLESLVDEIDMYVVQPRCIDVPPVQKTTMTFETLQGYRAYLEGHMLASEQDAGGNFVVGDHCKFCNVKNAGKCPVFEGEVFGALALPSLEEITMLAAMPEPTKIPVEQYGRVLAAAKLLKEYISEIEDLALEYSKQGIKIPGKKLVNTYARREWYGLEVNIARELMTMIGTEDWDVVYPRNLIGIGEAEGLVKTALKKKHPKMKAQAIGDMATQALAVLTDKKYSGNVTLVDERDNRQEVAGVGGAFAGISIPAPPKT